MFTNTARIKQKKRKAEAQEVDEPEDNDSVRSPRKKKHLCLLPSDQCVFCHKRVKKHGNKFQKLVQLTSKEKASEIKDRAESVSQEDSHHDINIARRILSLKDIDLVAQEAMYHSACHSVFIPPPKGYSSFSGTSSSSRADNERPRTSAHESAAKFLCDYVNASIIRDKNVEQISMLKEKYLQYMYENHPQYYNSDYKTDKLKNKLIRHFGTAISFWAPNHRAELVYASNEFR